MLGHRFRTKSEGRVPPVEIQTPNILYHMVAGGAHLNFVHNPDSQMKSRVGGSIPQETLVTFIAF